jgi:CzcA family heavy metal efflux pump
MVAFAPLFFLTGMEGRMLKPLGIAFLVSLFTSLAVAMTLTPLLSKLLLSNERYLQKNEKEKWLVRHLSGYYRLSLHWSLRHRKLVVIPVLLLFFAALGLLFTFGRGFLPEFNEGTLTLSVITQPGTSLEVSNQLGNMVEEELLSITEVTSTARRTGRGELDEHSQTTNSAEIDVNFTLKERKREAFMTDVRQRLAGIPGIAATVGQPLGHRIDHMLSGTRANIALKIFGTDLNRLHAIGDEIKNVIQGVEGLVDINMEQKSEVPQIQIRADRNLLAYYGVSEAAFHDYIRFAFGAEKLGEIYEGQRSFDLVLRFNKDYTESLEGIRSALIDTETGGKVPLEQLATIVSVTGPGSISRENVQRKVVVSANVEGGDLRGAVNEIQQRISTSVNLPENYRLEYGGQFESEANASRTLLLTSLLALLIIFLLLYQEFRNLKLAGIVLLNLPLALIGGVFAIWLSSGNLSIPAIIGFITLFGIATRNGILLISHYLYLGNRGMDPSETVIKGSADRLNPILMTALTAALALIPLAFRGDLSGNEIQSPMAKVILGGLLTSTLLNIYIVPIMYSLLKKPQQESEV